MDNIKFAGINQKTIQPLAPPSGSLQDWLGNYLLTTVDFTVPVKLILSGLLSTQRHLTSLFLKSLA
ncbi:Uncharacterised protein [uncultured archaeon]|nr:Uncharacterised protein [uncultured archaeon]